MSYPEFLAAVRERGEYPVDEAERVVESVLGVLGKRLPAGSVEHLAAQLPPPLPEMLDDPEDAHVSWGVEEFISHVAASAGEDRDTAETDTRVVFGVIVEQVSGGEMNKLLTQLPTGYAELFGYSELS